MNHTYILTDGNLKIQTPGVSSLTEVKTDFVMHTPERIVAKSTYPNGFQIAYDVQAGRITIACNRELVTAEDGSLIAPTA